MEDYESVLCVKNECFIYKIPPRTSNRGYRYPATFFEYIFRVNLNQDHYRRIRQIFSVGNFGLGIRTPFGFLPLSFLFVY